MSHLTEEKAFKTDYSNASRTQLFNIHTLQWDEELCRIYGVPESCLPEVCMSDSVFGHTTFGGLLKTPIPLCGVLGDSHAALLDQAAGLAVGGGQAALDKQRQRADLSVGKVALGKDPHAHLPAPGADR